MISVCLVDDQTLVRQGIRSLLELSDNIRIVAEAGERRSATPRHNGEGGTNRCWMIHADQSGLAKVGGNSG